MICQTPGCHRAAEYGFSVCTACLRDLLIGAFGPSPTPQSWHARARLGVGRTAIVGGVDSPPRAEAVPSGRRSRPGAELSVA